MLSGVNAFDISDIQEAESKGTLTCPYPKLGWLIISEISCGQRRDIPDQTSRGRASFYEKLNFS